MSLSSWGSSCRGFPARKGSLNDIKGWRAESLMNARQLIPISGTPGAVMKIGIIFCRRRRRDGIEPRPEDELNLSSDDCA